MTMYIRHALIPVGLSMGGTILEAWKKRLVGWFNVGLIFLAAFIVLFWVLPRFLPRKKSRRKRYTRATMTVLAIALLMILFSLLHGVGFGLGLGKGGGKKGLGQGEGNTNKQQDFKREGEIDIAIIGTNVYIDEEPVAIDKVRDQIKKKNSDSLTVVLIDAYSDYGTYTRVETILNKLLMEGKYEKRKEN